MNACARAALLRAGAGSGPATLAFAVAAGALVGCGGGLPLLHPARTLPSGEVRAEAGFSANVAASGFSDALSHASADQAAAGGAIPQPGTDPTFAKGALVEASVGPGIAPVAGARVGIGWQSEGGLGYTGRAVRVDVRRSFDLSESVSVSIGVGGSSVLYGRQSGGDLQNVSLGQIHGWGADVPLLLGYQSAGDLYRAWIGARAGWEGVEISDVTSEPKSVTLGMPPVGLSANRYWGGGLAGLAIGFRHVHVAMELDVAYATITGSFNQTSVTVSGLSLAPAAAAWWQF